MPFISATSPLHHWKPVLPTPLRLFCLSTHHPPSGDHQFVLYIYRSESAFCLFMLCFLDLTFTFFHKSHQLLLIQKLKDFVSNGYLKPAEGAHCLKKNLKNSSVSILTEVAYYYLKILACSSKSFFSCCSFPSIF